MEQSYGEIEGDSASAAELLCLMSAIADLPLRQDIAVTGSVDQWWRIQPIGAVNEKLEGFFDVCQTLGPTGQQGVCLPAANIRNLILRPDVADSIRQGTFHVWPVTHIDDAIELLSGLPAGTVRSEGTFHAHVDQRLKLMATALSTQKAFREPGASAPIERPAHGPTIHGPLPGRT